MARVSRKCVFEEPLRVSARIVIIFGICVGVTVYSALRDDIGKAFNTVSSKAIAAQQTLPQQ